MNESQKIAVRSEFDVFTARMQVRKLARAMGFDITNQARVALATSSLARALRLGEIYHGEVTIDSLGQNDDRLGIRVICKALESTGFEVGARAFTDVKWLVDDLTIEESSSDDIQVALVKWVA